MLGTKYCKESIRELAYNVNQPMKSILIVDDDEKILKFLSISLRIAGYTVFTTTSGEQAPKLVESEKPDLMLLDILMSPIDGLEVLKRLRTFSNMPVIVISAHSSACEKALELGANDFLDKPFRPDDVVYRIKRLDDKTG